MKLHLIPPLRATLLRFGLICSLASPALAVDTVLFEGTGDLNTHFQHAKTAALGVTHDPVSGVAGSGAIRLQNSANADGALAAVYAPVTFDATGGTNVWTTSIFLDTRSLGGDPAPFAFKEKEKLKVSLGFSGTNNLSNPVKFFDKKNTNNAATFRAQMYVEAEVQVEHDTGKQARLRLRLNSTPAWDQDQRGPQKEVTIPYPGPYSSLATWYRLDFRVEFLGAHQFEISAALSDVGPDGTGTPGTLVHQDTLLVTNAAFASYGTVYAAFSAEVEKKAANQKIFHLDNYRIAAEAIVPDAATALPATSVLANAAIANWKAATTGAATTGFVLELTTAADNFAPNTFVGADGTTGQASGIIVNDPAATELVLEGLQEGTAYVYRVIATNQGGASAASNVIGFQTGSEYVNAPPTLDPIPDLGPLWPNQPTVTVPLGGITAGLGDTGQTLTVTATSSNPAIVPDPAVTYTSPQETGSLTLTPAGGEGTATITVTVDDGQPLNNTITRTFTITTRIPPNQFDFEDEGALLGEFTLPNTQNAQLFFDEEGGIGNPPTGGLYYQGIGSNDNGAVFLRQQPYFMNPLPSVMRQSVLLNGRELAQNPTGSKKHQAEVEIGFRNQIAPFDAKAKDFFSKGGATNRAAAVRLQFRHEPNNNRIHEIRTRLRNYVGNGTSGQSAEIGVAGDISLYQHWLRLTLELVPISTSEMLLIYQLEDVGADGTDSPVLVLEDSVTVTNPGLLSAPEVYAGFVLSTEKNLPNRGLYVDSHKVEVLYTKPEAPTALPAQNVTAQNALVRWQRAEEGAVPFSYVVELSAEETFPPDSFISADGITGQSAGITISNSNTKSLQITGLSSATTYYVRVRGANAIGESAASSVISFTTLASGVNSPPTLDPLADLVLVKDAGEQTVTLKGISDGGELNQTVTLSATTSAPALLQNLQVIYNAPQTTGQLVFTPAFNTTGSATITVTAHDGAPNNATLSRSFTVHIVQVNDLVPFDTEAELDDYLLFKENANLTHLPAGGVGPQPGVVEFTRPGSNNDQVLVALRPQAYDARSTGYWVTSLFLHPAQVGAILSGKDRADIRLGFVAESTPGSALKDFFHKDRVGMGARFRFEHEPGKNNGEWQIEGQTFSTTPKIGGGFNDANGSKANQQDPAQFAHWMKLVVQLVRKSASQYEVRYAVEDWGPDGAAKIGTLLSGPPTTFTNAAFANDTSIFAGFLLNGEKNQSGSLFLDNHQVLANTKAPDAPLLQPAFDISSSGFTIAWNPAVIGRAIGGFIVQLVRNVSDFFTGLFLGTDGTEQNEGIVINDPDQQNLTFTGLQPYRNYHWRVLAFNEDDTSLPLAHQTTRTDALTFEQWREWHFPDDLFDETISGPYADPDSDGIPNLLEYALGGDPLRSDGSLTQHAIDEHGYFTLTFRRRAGADELLYDVQFSTDLTQPWQSLPGAPVAVSAPDEEGMETVTYRETAAMHAASKRFLRVRVELFDL